MPGDWIELQVGIPFQCQVIGLNYKLVFRFKVTAEMVEVGVREFVYETDAPAFLKKRAVRNKSLQLVLQSRQLPSINITPLPFTYYPLLTPASITSISLYSR